MIRNNASESLALLNSFFTNELSRIDIPELVRIDSPFGLWNSLVFVNSNLNTLKLENMEQAPYIINCGNLLELKLDKLQEVEFNASISSDGLYLNYLSNFPTKFLHNSKLQSLSLPNFKGTQYPLPSYASNINDANASAASFWDNYWLRDVSLGNSLMRAEDNSNYKFNGFWFNNNYFLKFLKLNYPYVIPLVRIAGLSTTPIGNGSGYIYVPDELLTSYRSAPQWNNFNQKFKGLSEYQQDFDLYTDSISDDWNAILTNCANNAVDKYKIGDTKTVMIDNIPTQFKIVGKNVDTLANQNGKAALSWMETKITRVATPQSVRDIFNNNAPQQFQNATNFREAVNQIYLKIEPTVKNGIKKVIKSSLGRDSSQAFGYYNSEDFLWPPSQLELGLDINQSPYQYYQTTPRRIINYYLGETNINEINGSKICVALRDYTNMSSNTPDLLRPNSDSTQSMEIINSNEINPYIITGFCT